MEIRSIFSFKRDGVIRKKNEVGEGERAWRELSLSPLDKKLQFTLLSPSTPRLF